jgi:hypothetical protein
MLINYKNKKINSNKIPSKIHICNNTTFAIIWKQIQIIWNWKQKTWNKIQCNINVLLHQISSLTPIISLFSSSKLLNVLMMTNLEFLLKSFLISHHEYEFKFLMNPNPSTLCYHFVLKWHDLLSTLSNGNRFILPLTNFYKLLIIFFKNNSRNFYILLL